MEAIVFSTFMLVASVGLNFYVIYRLTRQQTLDFKTSVSTSIADNFTELRFETRRSLALVGSHIHDLDILTRDTFGKLKEFDDSIRNISNLISNQDFHGACEQLKILIVAFEKNLDLKGRESRLLEIGKNIQLLTTRTKG